MSNEQCFFILKDGTKQEIRNISPHPETFLMSNDDVIKYLPDAVAVEHTHPDESPWLSKCDQQCMNNLGLPWLLHGNEYRPIPNLIGRTFEHGSVDCFTLMRDFYMLAGIEIFNYDRDDDWWLTSQNLYIDNLESAGFYKVDQPQAGDVAIICLGCQTPNHAAMLLDDGQVIHHLPNRLSKRDIYGGYYVKYTHSIWRHKKWLPSAYTAISANLDIK